MFRWIFRLLFGSEHPSKRELMACRDAYDALEARVDKHYDELKQVRGAVSRMKRDVLPPEDAPEPTNDRPDIVPPPPTQSTAHLARRFRS